MAAEVEIMFTDYDWQESVRPIIALNESLSVFSLYSGGNSAMLNPPPIEIVDVKGVDDMRSILEGYRDIFDAALRYVEKVKRGYGEETKNGGASTD